MLIRTTKLDRKMMRKSGLWFPRFFVFLPEKELDYHHEHAAGQHGHEESEEELRARAIMRLVWEKKRRGWKGLWGLVSVLIALSAFNVQNYGQNAGPLGALNPSHITTITFKDSSGVVIKTFASPWIFKCSTNITCSVSGNVMTVSSTGGGGGSPPTGTGFIHITGGVQDGAAKLVNLTAATDVAPNQGTATTVFHGNAAGQGAFGSVVQGDVTNGFVDLVTNQSILGTKTFDTVQLKKFAGLGWVDASGEAGADLGAKIVNAIADLPSYGGIIDATKVTTGQTISSDAFNTPKCIVVLLPSGQIDSNVQMNYATCTSLVVATPSAPALTGSGTGGTFTNASNTTVFVKITYALDDDSNRQTVASGETSIVLNSNGCTAGLTTCSVTVTSPAAATAAGAYNVYTSTTTGTEKLVNALPIPVGVNYVITANGAGVSPPSSTTAYYGYSAIIGAGRGATVFHFQSGGFLTSGCCRVNNFLIRDMTIVQDVGGAGQAKIVCFGCDNVEINNVDFMGGGQGIFWDGPTNSRLLHTKFTTLQDGVGYVNINADDFACNHLVIDDLTINGGRPPTGSNGYAFGVNNCDNVQASNIEADGIDGSQRTSYAAIAFSGVRNCAVSNILSHDHVSADGFAMVGNSQTGAAARNTAHCAVGVVTSYNNGKVAGSPNNGNGDGVDFQDVDDIIVGVLNLRANGLTVGIPNFECYYCTNVTVGTLNANGGKGGATIVSGQNVAINGGTISNNQGVGITHTSNTSVVNTVGTAVTWVSGGLFSNGWLNFPVVINVSGTTPTLFKVCSVQDFKHLTLCSGPANQTSQNMFVDTQNLSLSNLTVNSNGQALAAGDINRAGIYIASMGNTLAPTTFKLSSVVASDTQGTPTQTVGISIQNNALGSIIGLSALGNAGSTICAGAPQDICDSVGKTQVVRNDGTTPRTYLAPSTTAGASLNIPSGTAPTSPLSGDVWFDGTDFKVRQSTTTFSVEKVVASGTATFTTTAVAAAACQTTVTVAATNASTNDIIVWTFQSAPVAGTDASLIVNFWLTTGNVNFKRCNPTAASITPTALVANWQVLRR